MNTESYTADTEIASARVICLQAFKEAVDTKVNGMPAERNRIGDMVMGVYKEYADEAMLRLEGARMHLKAVTEFKHLPEHEKDKV